MQKNKFVLKGLWGQRFWSKFPRFPEQPRWLYAFRPRLHEQIKHALFAQILPELLLTDREFEQLKVTLFAHVNKALGRVYMSK